MLDLDAVERDIPSQNDSKLAETTALLLIDVNRRLDRLTRAVSHVEDDDELALEERLR